jgi:hypothetical protein
MDQQTKRNGNVSSRDRIEALSTELAGCPNRAIRAIGTHLFKRLRRKLEVMSKRQGQP